ncbi:hypothetical protein C8Q75DRAFT_723638 [Abortiporus biennis]|nr:hypothetical protein C8Q75DRAFT_723638 [Abortiporus biennis]
MSLNIQEVEKALLLGRWEVQATPSSPIADLARDVVNGSFRGVLTSSQARDLFTIHSQDKTLLDKPLDEWFDFSTKENSSEQELLRLLLGVACLHAFLQANWTGPNLDFKPLDFITVPPQLESLITEESLKHKTVKELAYGGEPAYHLADSPILLRLAKILFELPYQFCQSANWWKLRAWNVHEQVLDEPTAVPANVLGSLESLSDTFATDPELAGRLMVEQGLLEHRLSNDKSAAEFFVRAARKTHLQYELTGALGKRTKFQQKDVTQLVLLAESQLKDHEQETTEKSDSSIINNGAPPVSSELVPETMALNDDTLLEQTQFTSSNPAAPDSSLSHLDPGAQPPLHPLDQCILLSLCLNIKNTSPSHGLTAEQMSPYVARVISHPRNWSVHTMALLLRSRLESNRTRTVERSTFQLQALVDQMPTADSSVTERLLYIHSIPLPSKWEMEKELAMRFLSLGVVKSALEIFERLEMWEQVVMCWQSMEKRDKGITIVRDLLEGRKSEADTVISRNKPTSDSRRQVLDAAREAKLWCLLGELEPEQAKDHYEYAWNVSKETSGRAMRSLGGYYFARSDYPNTIACLRKAVAINPLLGRSWFVLGCAYVRQEEWEGARDAFARCVTIDDEDGESWNNLASVYLRMGEADKSIPFSNRMLAFRALKQGLKFSYENWRMWSNYMIVAMDVGELSEACHALGRIVELRSAKEGAASVDEDVLERLVNAVTRGSANPNNTVEDNATVTNASLGPNEGQELHRRVTDLFERVILPRVSSPRIFRARGRLLTWEGKWEDALNAYLEAYRCGTAATIEKGETDLDKWREGINEVEEIVDVLRNFGPKIDGCKWRLQGRSIVRTFMARTRDFEDEPEWSRLSTLQEELRKEE